MLRREKVWIRNTFCDVRKLPEMYGFRFVGRDRVIEETGEKAACRIKHETNLKSEG